MLGTLTLLSTMLAAPVSTVWLEPPDSPTFSQPLPKDLRASAQRFALSRHEQLKLPPGSTLGPAEAFGTRFGASFRMKQQVLGVDVHGGQVVVTVDAGRRVWLMTSSVVTYGRAVSGWSLTGDDALRVAAEQTPWPLLQPSGRPYGGVRRMMFPVGGELRAGYLAFVPSLDPREHWVHAVDASSGAHLWRRSRAYQATDEAAVYPRSPGGLDAGVGAAPVSAVVLRHADGGAMVTPVDGGYLEGTQLTAFNCCPGNECDGGTPKRGDGGTRLYGFNITYDVAVCSRTQRASNDPAVNPDASFVFPPIDPPAAVGGAPVPVAQSEPADSDLFSEVHAFYHVNRVYDFMKELSSASSAMFPGESIPGFRTRDERRMPPRKLAVWSNVTLPDFEEMQRNFNLFTFSTKADGLLRIDNAAYLALENFSQVVLPEYMLDVDTLMMFQGHRADYSYDSSILSHEFGHGVVYGTAAFDGLHFEPHAANNEAGALHEGFADYFAAAFGQSSRLGEYVGPRIRSNQGGAGLSQDVSLRDLDTVTRCPEVLTGEVHEDSRPFSSALWRARRTLFQGSDSGRTFDAAVYAALVSMTPATGFEDAAAVLTAHVKQAFPGLPQAESEMNRIFTEHGIKGCVKLVDVTGATQPRPYIGMGGRKLAGLTSTAAIVPGPYQMKVQVPAGAQSVKVTGTVTTGRVSLVTPLPRLLVKANQPVSFTRAPPTVNHDADAVANASVTNTGAFTATAQVQVPCGAEVFVALGTSSEEAEVARAVNVTVEPLARCPTPDAGTETDAGVVRVRAVEDGAATGPAAGCGCGGPSGGGLPGTMAALALLYAWAAQRRRKTWTAVPERAYKPQESMQGAIAKW